MTEATSSTVVRGNSFRDTVVALLKAADYTVEVEVPIAGKNVDVYATRQEQFSLTRLAIEAKDYTGNLPIGEVLSFVQEYGALTLLNKVDHSFLVTKGDITSPGKSTIAAAQGKRLNHFTWASFQRRIFASDQYLNTLTRNYSDAGIEHYFVPPKTSDRADLLDVVINWMAEEGPPPLVILGGYGTGKSTFAQTLANRLALAALQEPSSRIPILVPLGDIVDENSLEGLFGKLLASTYRVSAYHFSLFRELNRLGRFVIILDGFDEMKHGMTFSVFQRECNRLFELQEGDARVLLLGRPNAFASDREFQAVIKGRITTSSGDQFPHPSRPECRDVRLGEWSAQEAQHFVSTFFPFLARAHRWAKELIDDRCRSLLTQRFDQLIRRPVHAQMLCQIALDPAASLSDIDEFKLYDRFIALLLTREYDKVGRYAGFSVDIRRRFNAAVSWWLMTNGGASSTTITDVPDALCRAAVGRLTHHFDAEGLKHELIAGCLIEKAGGTVYFGHRSTQEFLAAEYLYETAFLSRLDPVKDVVAEVTTHASPEISQFLVEFFDRYQDGPVKAAACCDLLVDYKRDICIDRLDPFIAAYTLYPRDNINRYPWLYLLDYWSQFELTTSDAAPITHLLKTLTNVKTDQRIWLAALQQVCLEISIGRDFPIVNLIAVIIHRSDLAGPVGQVQANGANSSKPIYVRDEDYVTFCLIDSIKSELAGDIGRDDTLLFDHKKVRKTARRLLGYGPILSALEQPPSAQQFSVQALFRVLGSTFEWNSGRLDKIRPYFYNVNVRRRIRPLEVETKPRPAGRGLGSISS